MSTDTTTDGPFTGTGRPADPHPAPVWLWRLGGALGLAQVVMMMAAITQEPLVSHGAPLTELQVEYGGADLARTFAAGYVEALSFIVLTPAIVIIARLFGHGSEPRRIASQTFLAFGIAFVASTLAVGFAPGAAAIYGAHHGADIGSVAMVNDLRNFGFYLQVTIQGGMAIALGAAAILGRLWTRTIGWTGVVIGVALLVGTPFAHEGLGLLWLVWWVGLTVLMLKGGPRRA